MYLYRNGTDNFIKNPNGNFKIFTGSDKQSLIARPNGAVELYHNDSKKFETTSTGASVTGSLTVSSDLDVTEDIRHVGDSDTKIKFADNQVMIHTAGTEALDIKSDGAMVFGHNDEISFNSAEAVRLNIPANTDLNNSGANRDNKGKITICGGDADNTTPNDDNSVIQIVPEGTRSSVVGSKHGGICWQHLSPLNWDGYQGNQIWMGSSLHDTSGQERANYQIWMNSQTTAGSQPNNHAFNLSPEGYHRFPKLPAFSAHTQNTRSSNATLVFERVVVNNGSHYNTSTGRFTAPEAGMYFFSFHGMGPSNTSNNIRLHFRINNAYHASGEHYGGVTYSGGDHYSHLGMTTILDLSANDYVSIYLDANYDSLHDSHNKFNGFKIG